MFGLILSILIFTNIINFFKDLLHVNILGLIYIYLLLIAFIMEILKILKKNNFYNEKNIFFNAFKILFLITETNTQAIFSMRKRVNFLSIIYFNNKLQNFDLIFEKIFKINYKNIFNFSYMILGKTFFCLNLYKYIKYKPNYFLYLEINLFINNFCMSISDYIFLSYHKFSFSDEILNSINKTKINLLNFKL